MKDTDYERRLILQLFEEDYNLNFAMLSHLHLLQVCVGIEILDDTAVQPFIDGFTERRHFLLLIFQQSQTGSDNLTDIVISAGKDARLDKLLKMGS